MEIQDMGILCDRIFYVKSFFIFLHGNKRMKLFGIKMGQSNNITNKNCKTSILLISSEIHITMEKHDIKTKYRDNDK